MNDFPKSKTPWLLIELFVFSTLLHADDNRPNIVLIMVDDMGWSDIGSYGGEIPTPYIDSLAVNGIRFTQFYNAARCYPTRASLLTGLHPHQTGIGAATNSPRGLIGDHGVYGYRGYLNRNSLTLAEVLGEAGYHTYMAGKWHQGYHTPDRWPKQRGFERFYGIISGASSFFKPQGGRGLMLDNTPLPPPVTPNYYTTDAFTDYAVHFIKEQNSDDPFFLYLAYTAPHWPLHAKEGDIQKFVGKYKPIGWDKLRKQRFARQLDLGLLDESHSISPRNPGARAWEALTEEQQDQLDYRMAVYAAMIHCVDYNVGKVIDSLKSMGKFENTMILFLADNGGCAEPYNDLGGRSFDLINDPNFSGNVSYGTAWANVSNTPFRKFKVWLNEGGISTPLIIHWPNGIDTMTNQWIRTPAYLPDIAPTFYEVAGAEYPSQKNGYDIHPLKGQSLLTAFKTGQLVQHEWMFWEHMKHRAVRRGKFKALWAREIGKWALYDIEKDRNEMHDLSELYPELLKSMTDKWETWARDAKVYPYAEKLKLPVAPERGWSANYDPDNVPELIY